MKLFLRASAGTELALQSIEFDTYRIAIGSNCVEFDTRFNVNKYITCGHPDSPLVEFQIAFPFLFFLPTRADVILI